MKVGCHILLLALLIPASFAYGAVPITVEVAEVKKIWDRAPHSAFTDLIRWNEKFYCAFRVGRGHVSTDGKIRVLESKDANLWESAALVALEGYDLRDAHLSVTPDGRLMLLGGIAPRKQDNQGAPTGSFVCFSQDGSQWTKPQIVVEPGRWLWCVTWHKGKAYGVSYAAGERMPYIELLVSDNGTDYQCHVDKLFGTGYPTEVTLRFDTDDTCYALVRRDRRGNEASSALLGVSKPGYKKWQWHDLGQSFNGFGGPNFIRIPSGHWLGAGRMHEGGAHTALTYIDVKNGTMTKLLKLPSGGDTSYPGLVWYEDMLYVSYYSSHEGKTSIYLAKVKVKPKERDEEENFGAETNPTEDPIGGGKGYRRLVKQGDYQVKTLEELLAALKQAKAGQVVYVDEKAEIDLTGKQKIVIPGGVTVASGRGQENSEGALLYSNELKTSPLFLAGGEKVRVTGLRLRGPDPNRRTEQMQKLYKEGRYYSIPNSDGIISTHPHLEVDNCELWAWSHAAVFLKRGASKAHIHHNYIHHNQRSGLGYGVCLDQSDALIEANLFDWCRHHIAGTGRPGTSYEARYNVVLENANGHSFDMHGGRDRKDGTDIAGDSIKIHHNKFKATSVPAIVIRGRPTQSTEIHHNRFLHADRGKAVRQTNAVGNMNVYRNQFTAARTLKD
ncbi:MAG TPA: right-handed parallel beta-helix repeat-containing protein [Sedimentisphaerales bacterium]|nr:right-handed parallel beta-helix repeat-containing protein [Sedimentisphaerales bacterium]